MLARPSRICCAGRRVGRRRCPGDRRRAGDGGGQRRCGELTTGGTPGGSSTAWSRREIWRRCSATSLVDPGRHRTRRRDRQLRDLNLRARAFVLRSLTGAASVDWLARFTRLVDAAIVGRLISLTAWRGRRAAGVSAARPGREESSTLAPPALGHRRPTRTDRDHLACAMRA